MKTVHDKVFFSEAVHLFKLKRKLSELAVSEKKNLIKGNKTVFVMPGLKMASDHAKFEITGGVSKGRACKVQ